MKKRACGISAMVLLALGSAKVSFGQGLASSISTVAENNGSQVNLHSLLVQTDNTALTYNTNFSFNGLMGNGQPGTINFGVNAAAQSDYGVLHASFNSTLTNAFNNPTNPIYDPSTQQGVPETVGGQSDAEFTDRVAVAGGAGLTGIRLMVHLDGNLSQTGSFPFSSGYAALWEEINNVSNIVGPQILTLPGGSSSVSILTDPFPVVGGFADINVLLQANVDWIIAESGTQYIPDGSNLAETVDFFNTATITGIEGVNSGGNDVPLSSVVGNSGMVYPSSVPEPTSGLLLLFGAGLLTQRRSQRRARS